MKHQAFRSVTFFLVALSFILQSIPEVGSKGSSGGSRGSGQYPAGWGSRYTGNSSSKSFIGKSVAFGAGAYIGYTAVKIAQKVKLGASLGLLYKTVIIKYNDNWIGRNYLMIF